jgi:acyl carrier protein
MDTADRTAVEDVIFAILQEVAVTAGASEPITPDTYLVRDVGVDSLGVVTIAARVAETFAVEPPEGMLEDVAFMTVRDIVAACADLVRSRQMAQA